MSAGVCGVFAYGLFEEDSLEVIILTKWCLDRLCADRVIGVLFININNCYNNREREGERYDEG
ncbi:MAG: hypothetical protein JRD69_04435 [Deltaproteobacteria bacterium]|nr:hypothetical protein [Deltaproteobacteria bacterium]